MRDQILQLVQRYLGDFHPSGEYNVSTMCPFHQVKDGRPFSVNTQFGLYHCLAGETQVLTPEGPVCVRDLCGEKTFVLVPALENIVDPSWGGSWKQVIFHHYGRQRLWELVLTRNHREKIIRTTELHRWFVRCGEGRKEKKEVVTRSLKTGDRLSYLFPIPQSTRRTVPSSFGVAHGFVFGDGTSYRGTSPSCRVTLWGDKDRELLPYFPFAKPRKRTTKNGCEGEQILGLPRFFKHLPHLHESAGYLLGFLAGYFAADGCVGDNGHPQFSSASKEMLEQIRGICAQVGVATYGIHHQERKGFGQVPTPLYFLPIIASSVSSSFFILKEHRRRFAAKTRQFERLGWQVKSVRQLDTEEDVFCTEVPEQHAFVLEDNILTGNCFTCGKAGTIVNMLRDLGVDENIIKAETDSIRDAIQHNRVIYKYEKENTWRSPKDQAEAEYPLTESVITHFKFDSAGCRKHPTKLLEDDFSHEILDFKEVGLDEQNQRIIYPIRDIYGNLAGVSGGALYDQKPKYKVYQGPRRLPDGKRVPSDYGLWFDEQYPDYEFHNHLYVWNYERVYPRAFYGKEVQTIIITEGFKACMWLLQLGYGNTVALMGSKISPQQLWLLLRPEARYLLFLDNDQAGLEGTRSIGNKLYQRTTGVSIACYSSDANGCQPDDLTEAGVRNAIEQAVPYPLWKGAQNESRRIEDWS